VQNVLRQRRFSDQSLTFLIRLRNLRWLAQVRVAFYDVHPLGVRVRITNIREA
jgi:hypothetical protein